MAEPYFPGGPRPQGLGKTLEDFQRFGKGLLVGETADILGLPADLTGLYFDMRYGSTPKGIESLINRFGSEALAKKFMGEDFPEFSFENFGQDTKGGIESAGRMFAPGALLTKAIASARLAAKLKNRPPSGGGFGGPQFAMAGAGASKLPPPTTAETLMMTTDNVPAAPREPERVQVFEDDYLKKDISTSAQLSKDGVFFSNLLQEIENIGTGQGELQQLRQTRMPILENFTTKKGKKGQRPKKDEFGNIMYQDGVTTRVEGIEFPMTGAQILEKFKTLKDGTSNRLYKEAEETGLIRYLELNPKEKFEADGGKEKLYNIASQFTPEIESRVYRESDLQAIEAESQDIMNKMATPNMTTEEIAALQARGDELADRKNKTIRGMGNLNQQRIDPGGDAVYDVVHTIFGTGARGNEIVGSSIDKLGETQAVKQELKKLEDFFKSTGDTDSLKKLTQSYSEHGFGNAVDGGYFAHTRSVDGFMGFEIGPNAPELEDARFFNEFQNNQGMTKSRKMVQDSPVKTADVQRNIQKQKDIIDVLDNEMAQKNIDAQNGTITQAELKQFENYFVSEKTKRKNNITNLNKILDRKNDIVLNSKLMDVNQVLKIDKEQKLGISTFSETKVKLQDEGKEINNEIDRIMVNIGTLDKSIDPLKKQVFQVDNDLEKFRSLSESQQYNKTAIDNFFDEDVANPGANQELFLVGDSTFNPSYAIRDDVEAVDLMQNNVPYLIKKFMSSGVKDDDVQTALLKTGIGFKSSLTGNQVQAFQKQAMDKINERFKFGGDTLQDNPLNVFLKSGDDSIQDSNMVLDHYRTVEKLVNDGKIDVEQFNSAFLADGIGTRLGKDKGRLAPILNNITYEKYVQMKVLDNPNYFKTPQNISKFFKDAYRNHGLALEKKYINAQVVKNLVNSNELRRIAGEDNIKELAQRLKVAKDKPGSYNDKSGDYLKIYQDFQADFEVAYGSSGKGSKVIEKVVNETVDKYINTTKRIPISTSQAGYRKTTEGFGSTNVADFEYTPPSSQNLLSKFVSPSKGKLNIKPFTATPETLRNQIKRDLILNTHANVFGKYSNAIIDSMAHQDKLKSLDGERAILANRLRKGQAKLSQNKIALRPFLQRGAIQKLINELGDKVPDSMKNSLKEAMLHADSNQSFQFQKNPPIQNSQQGLDLMVHKSISDAKKEGKRYVIFPKLADYAAARGSGKPAKYKFAAGDDELGGILKKHYGSAYFTTPNVYSSSSKVSPTSSRILRMGSGSYDRNSPDFVNDADHFRVIDLTKIDSNLKIPRFKKGGIFNKFRKVA